MAKAPPPRLEASLIAAKGAAAPSVAPPPAQTPAKALISVTLRLDQGRYERLKAYGARRRMSNQEILAAALDRILEADGA